MGGLMPKLRLLCSAFFWKLTLVKPLPLLLAWQYPHLRRRSSRTNFQSFNGKQSYCGKLSVPEVLTMRCQSALYTSKANQAR